MYAPRKGTWEKEIMSDNWVGFSRKEFECKCGCGFDDISEELVQELMVMKEFFGGVPVYINCGCRCEKHNAMVGGAKHSQHVLGTAADIRVKGFTPDSVAEYLEDKYPDSFGIGRYNTFTHFDVRPYKARWDNRT